jgi:hypothetical protein
MPYDHSKSERYAGYLRDMGRQMRKKSYLKSHKSSTKKRGEYRKMPSDKYSAASK